MMPLTVEQNTGTYIRIEYRNGFRISVPDGVKEWRDEAIRRELRAWFRFRLAQDATAFVTRYGRKLNVKAKRVSIKARRHFWGYCSQDGVIGVHWHLILAPKQVLEYVVAHELCHLKHRNHAEDFWFTLGSVFPDWQICKSWLDKNESLWDVAL